MLHVRVCEGRTRRIDEGHMSVEMKRIKTVKNTCKKEQKVMKKR